MKEEILNQFVFDFEKKWEKGQAEHGGQITDRCLNDEARNEAIDLVAYLGAQKEQKKKIVSLIEDLVDTIAGESHVLGQDVSVDLNAIRELVEKL